MISIVTHSKCRFYGQYVDYKTKEISCGPCEMLIMKCTICYNVGIFNEFMNQLYWGIWDNSYQ